jgi:hypothetical protein
MLFITTYRLKPFLSNDETRQLLEAFATAGPGPGTTAHYVAVDGSCGVVISENDDIEAAYRNLLNYGQWIQYDTKVMLTIDQALPHIMDALN